jgi:hypothetical protein
MGYEPDDLDVINELVRLHPAVNELLVAVKSVAAATQFPIESRGELAEALARRPGGEEPQHPSEASRLLSAITSEMPAYYFPIVSRRDLTAKLVEFDGLRRARPETAAAQPAGPSAAAGVDQAIRLIRPDDVKESPLGPTDSPPRSEPMSAQLEWPSVGRR